MSWLTAPRNWIARRYWQFTELDPELPLYEAWVAVRVHWVVYAVCFFILFYRPYYGAARFAVYGLAMLVLVLFNGYLHTDTFAEERDLRKLELDDIGDRPDCDIRIYRTFPCRWSCTRVGSTTSTVPNRGC